MKITDYGKWTKIYQYDGYGFRGECDSAHKGFLEEPQVSEICRSYAVFEHIKDGIIVKTYKKDLWKNIKVATPWDGYGHGAW